MWSWTTSISLSCYPALITLSCFSTTNYEQIKGFPPPRFRSKAYQEAKTLELPGGTHAGALPLNPARGAYGSPRTPSCRTLHSLCSLHSVFLPFLNSLCHPCFLHPPPPHESFKVIWTSSFEIHTSPVEDFWKVFYRGSSIFKWISLSSNSIWNLQW